ncbi:MAG: TonB-dependent receptor [Phenylobacterium sp.]|uniref:TonB-dependent receptor n=1 Tax=Phenylobacterium sp. TaxID=1871053 RepID=UPI00391D3448
MSKLGLIAGVAYSSFLASAGVSAAQPADTLVVEEVVVTAQKRSERLQDVPVSVTALSGEALAAQRVTQIDDLVNRVPNLQLSATSGANTPIFALRGVSMSDYSLNQASPVATYFDEVYKGNFALLGVAMFDLERVEVLRGPQGTLYGKNTTGGAVNLISRTPTFNQAADLEVGYGAYERFDLSGAVNLPLSDQVAARVAFTRSTAEGWYRNRYRSLPDASGIDEFGVRASLLFAPSEAARFVVRASTSLQRPIQDGIYAEPGPLGIGAGVYQLFGEPGYFRRDLEAREIESNFVARRRAQTYAFALTSELQLSDTLALTAVSSYDRGSISIPEDTDGSPLSTLELPSGGKATQFAQDLRVSGGDGAFRYLLGAYAHVEEVFNRNELGIFKDLDVDQDGRVTAADCAVGFPLACRVRNRFDQEKRSFAVYSDMRFELTPRVTIRGGLRYTQDRGELRGLRSELRGVDDGLVGVLIDAPDGRGYRSRNLSGKAGVDLKTPNGDLLYLSYNRGYRGSAFNAQALFDISELNVAKPELIDAFEAGAKTQLLSRRVTLNGAAFYYRYRDQQFLDIDPANSTQRLVNLERSRIYGAELELSAVVTDALRLSAGLGLLNSRIERGSLRGVSLKGKVLPNAPAVTANAEATYIAIDDDRGRLTGSVHLSYASSQFFEVFNVPRLEQDGYALIDARLSYELPGERWAASIWGKNLTDETYFTSRIDLRDTWGFDYNHLGAPRTFGVTLAVRSR